MEIIERENRALVIRPSNGDEYRLKEDVENHLQITKAFSEENVDRIRVYPRYSNEITVN